MLPFFLPHSRPKQGLRVPTKPEPFRRREWVQLLIFVVLVVAAILLGLNGYKPQGLTVGMAAVFFAFATTLGRRFMGIQ